MTQATDPTLYTSAFERIPKDRYWTHPSVTAAFLRRFHSLVSEGVVPPVEGQVWEPSCGRGDIARCLIDYGYELICTDIDMSEFDAGLPVICQTQDFLSEELPDYLLPQVGAIVMNPPYDKAEEFLKRALSFENVRVVAAVLRSEFNSAKGKRGARRRLFSQPPFAYEIVLTSRPRWDWWFRDKPEASPRHNYSWFVWDRQWQGRSTQFWEGRSADD